MAPASSVVLTLWLSKIAAEAPGCLSSRCPVAARSASWRRYHTPARRRRLKW